MFIAVDLKVIEGLAGATARAAGVSEDAVLAGLIRAWHRCWADEIDTIADIELAGLFSTDDHPRMANSLAAFGFIEAVEKGFRIRGASRYLRLKESRRRGAEITNSARALKRRSESEPERTLKDALSPSHRVTESPSTEEKLAGAQKPRTPRHPKEPKPTDPRHAPLIPELVATYADCTGGAKYAFGPRDAAEVSRLLALAGPEEDAGDNVLARWSKGLRLKFNPCRTLAGLVKRWNEFPAVRADEMPEQGAML